MRKHILYARVDGDPWQSRLVQYRKDLFACHDAWRAYAKEMNADEIPGSLSGLIFHDRKKVPQGWLRPKRNGWTRPKKGHADEAVIDALPKEPSRWDALRGAYICTLSYETPSGGWGSGAIGGLFFGPVIGWVEDLFLVVLPDAKAAADDHLAEHPDHKITNGCETWTLPEGLTRISEAEHDLIVAQYKVAQERAA
jgi:hypothetical protein